MSYMTETAKRIPAGDGPKTFMGETARKPQLGATGRFVTSDLPGFLHPVLNGQPDKASYVPEAAVNAASDEPPPVLTREEAMAQKSAKKRPIAETIYPQAGQ